ncbi:MAG: FtsX-like permease family protein, partial [bacterium]|nr:FtsX-like permease family protein [bacterium]
PALFLSAYQPISVMKGVTKRGRLRAAYFRRILVVTQFSLSVILIIGSIVIAKQLEYIKNKDMGFDKENLLLMRMGISQYESVKNDLLKDPAIINVTKTNAPLLWLGFETSGVTWEGKGSADIMTIQLRTVDYDYLTTFGMEMKEGRFFQREFVSDSAQGFIVNEAAAEVMGIEKPVGTSFALDGGKRGTIIGVVKDFHHHSMRDKIEPLVLYMHNSWYSNMFVRVAPGRTQDAMALLRREWSRIDPGYPFQVNFFDERVERMYMDEQKAGRVLNYFTVIAMFIAALGLYGLASYMAEQRTKEIGIRKVLGAKVSSIMADLIKEFVRWVIISNAIAWPLAYIAAKKWLQNFAYKTSIGPEIFLFAGIIVLATALLTVGYQTIKAATANPVRSLRYE